MNAYIPVLMPAVDNMNKVRKLIIENFYEDNSADWKGGYKNKSAENTDF